MFSMDPPRKAYQEQNFNITEGEEGGPEDRPLIVQFCANNPDQLLKSAQIVAPHCDAVDINLGCPQDIAKKGRYGAFLQDDWELIYSLSKCPLQGFLLCFVVFIARYSQHVTQKLVRSCHCEVSSFPNYRKNSRIRENAGASRCTNTYLSWSTAGTARAKHSMSTFPQSRIGLNCLHQGLADWDKIRAVKEAVTVPVFANGNILYHSDIERCLQVTGADAVMSAEGQLYNPTLFAPAQSPSSSVSSPLAYDTGLHLPHADLALEYLEIVKRLKTRTPMSAVKGHMFKILRPALSKETDLRDKMGRVKNTEQAVDDFIELAREMKRRMDVSLRHL